MAYCIIIIIIIIIIITLIKHYIKLPVVWVSFS